MALSTHWRPGMPALEEEQVVRHVTHSKGLERDSFHTIHIQQQSQQRISAVYLEIFFRNFESAYLANIVRRFIITVKQAVLSIIKIILI